MNADQSPAGSRRATGHKDHQATNDYERETMQMDFYQERVRLAEHLDRIQKELTEMLTLWTERDLPPDVLTEDEYPFQLSLDEMTSEVQGAVEMIRDRNLLWGA